MECLCYKTGPDLSLCPVECLCLWSVFVDVYTGWSPRVFSCGVSLSVECICGCIYWVIPQSVQLWNVFVCGVYLWMYILGDPPECSAVECLCLWSVFVDVYTGWSPRVFSCGMSLSVECICGCIYWVIPQSVQLWNVFVCIVYLSMYILADPPECSAVECYSSCIVLWLQQSDGKEFRGGVCVCWGEDGWGGGGGGMCYLCFAIMNSDQWDSCLCVFLTYAVMHLVFCFFPLLSPHPPPSSSSFLISLLYVYVIWYISLCNRCWERVWRHATGWTRLSHVMCGLSWSVWSRTWLPSTCRWCSPPLVVFPSLFSPLQLIVL